MSSLIIRGAVIKPVVWIAVTQLVNLRVKMSDGAQTPLKGALSLRSEVGSPKSQVTVFSS